MLHEKIALQEIEEAFETARRNAFEFAGFHTYPTNEEVDEAFEGSGLKYVYNYHPNIPRLIIEVDENTSIEISPLRVLAPYPFTAIYMLSIIHEGKGVAGGSISFHHAFIKEAIPFFKKLIEETKFQIQKLNQKAKLLECADNLSKLVAARLIDLKIPEKNIEIETRENGDVEIRSNLFRNLGLECVCNVNNYETIVEQYADIYHQIPKELFGHPMRKSDFKIIGDYALARFKKPVYVIGIRQFEPKSRSCTAFTEPERTPKLYRDAPKYPDNFNKFKFKRDNEILRENLEECKLLDKYGYNYGVIEIYNSKYLCFQLSDTVFLAYHPNYGEGMIVTIIDGKLEKVGKTWHSGMLSLIDDIATYANPEDFFSFPVSECTLEGDWQFHFMNIIYKNALSYLLPNDYCYYSEWETKKFTDLDDKEKESTMYDNWIRWGAYCPDLSVNNFITIETEHGSYPLIQWSLDDVKGVIDVWNKYREKLIEVLKISNSLPQGIKITNLMLPKGIDKDESCWYESLFPLTFRKAVD